MNNYGYIKVAAATPSVRVADCEYNSERIVAMMQQAAECGVRAVVFPELCVTASTCQDLFLQRTLIRCAEQTLMQIVEASVDFPLVAIVGVPLAANNKLYNCAAIISQGMLIFFTISAKKITTPFSTPTKIGSLSAYSADS